MSLSTAEIVQVVEELSYLEGLVVQRVWAPEHLTVVLRLRGRGRTLFLLISVEPNLTRLHLVSERPRPAGEPAPLQAALRAELEGLRLQAVRQEPGERLVELLFSRGQPAPGRKQEGHDRRVVAELFGRSGNIFILDEESRVLHAARTSIGRERDNRPGRPYQPPKPAREAASGHARRSRFQQREPGAAEPFPVNDQAEALYTPLIEKERSERRRRRIERPLTTMLKRSKRALAKLDEEERRAGMAETYRRYGELLKPSLHLIERGAEEAKVIDWYAEGTPEVAIPLREDLSPKENMSRYFALHRKLRTASEHIEGRRRLLIERQSRTAKLLEMVREAEGEGDLAEAERAAAGLGVVPREAAGDERARKPKPEAKSPYRRYSSATGRPILVGRGAVENDELTFKVARGNDVWVHVRGYASSHVVIPVSGYGEPDEQTLLDAATLAAYFSKARGEAVVDVAWTFRKHVRKSKGAPPGKVAVSQERGLMLRLEKDRLDRILKNSGRN